MQSWGVRSRWDVRDSAPEPSKSGVIGLLGCGLGLARQHPRLLELDRALQFAVRGDRPGVIATDYQTVTGRHRMANGKLKTDDYTVQSYREYLHDASFLVALAGEEPLLRELAGALQTPKWPLFLGRKSCVPTRPVLENLSDQYADLEDAVCRAPWSAPVDTRTRQAILRTFPPEELPLVLQSWSLDPPQTSQGPAHELTAWVQDDQEGDLERQDIALADPLRFYGFRRVRRVRISLDHLEGVLE